MKISRYKKLISLYKKSAEEIGSAEEKIAKKLLRMTSEKLSLILKIILEDNEDVRNNVYNSVYKSNKELDDLA